MAATTPMFCVRPRATLSLKAPCRRQAVVLQAAQKAEYIWADGCEGAEEKGVLFNEMRSKTKCISTPITSGDPADFPTWSFDGSSTGQAQGRFSDCVLQPVRVVPDPIRGSDSVLVLCMVMNPDLTPHDSNERHKLMQRINDEVKEQDCLFGFEQEYTMMDGDQVYGWPKNGYPAPQGPFYCGVGDESTYGRPLAEDHLDACVESGLTISGINAEVMPGQWEFQIGPAGPLEMGDEVLLARWLLYRLGEDHGITCTLAPKPIKGDWNGAGAHTNFSTKAMRADGGMEVIETAVKKLEKTHMEHIAQYGANNEQRLTGKHETADMNTFGYGVADRGASVRIPLPVSIAGKGYFEDRRPAANVNPYTVARLLIASCFN